MNEVPRNFNEISQRLFDMMSKKLNVVFSIDMYKTDSVKSTERERSGCSENLIIKGENTKNPAD